MFDILILRISAPKTWPFPKTVQNCRSMILHSRDRHVWIVGTKKKLSLLNLDTNVGNCILKWLYMRIFSGVPLTTTDMNRCPYAIYSSQVRSSHPSLRPLPSYQPHPSPFACYVRPKIQKTLPLIAPESILICMESDRIFEMCL